MTPQIYFITIHPELIAHCLNFGVFNAAQKKQLAHYHIINLRDYAVDDRGTIDGHPYGGGDSMVMRVEPLTSAIESLPVQPYVILTSPRGKHFVHADALRLAHLPTAIAFICGRFAGPDERFVELMVDEELSIGDFIISGGEWAALCFADSLTRLIPGTLGNSESALQDSFSPHIEGRIEAPSYTRPTDFRGLSVPKELLSGNHQKISQWRKQQSVLITQKYKNNKVP